MGCGVNSVRIACCASQARTRSRAARHRPHGSHPELERAPWVVVRRAAPLEGRIAVGVRGRRRSERFAAWLDPAAVREWVDPLELAARRAWRDWPRTREIQALAALGEVERDHGTLGSRLLLGSGGKRRLRARERRCDHGPGERSRSDRTARSAAASGAGRRAARRADAPRRAHRRAPRDPARRDRAHRVCAGTRAVPAAHLRRSATDARSMA